MMVMPVVPVLADAAPLAFDQLAVKALPALHRLRARRRRWAPRVLFFSRVPDRPVHLSVDAAAGFGRRDFDRVSFRQRRFAVPPLQRGRPEGQEFAFEGDVVGAGLEAANRIIPFRVGRVAALPFTRRFFHGTDEDVRYRETRPDLADVAEDLRPRSEFAVDPRGGCRRGDAHLRGRRPGFGVFVELPQVVDPVPAFEFDAVFPAGQAIEDVVAVAVAVGAARRNPFVVDRAGCDAGDWQAGAFVGHGAADRAPFGEFDAELPVFCGAEGEEIGFKAVGLVVVELADVFEVVPPGGEVNEVVATGKTWQEIVAARIGVHAAGFEGVGLRRRTDFDPGNPNVGVFVADRS